MENGDFKHCDAGCMWGAHVHISGGGGGWLCTGMCRLTPEERLAQLEENTAALEALDEGLVRRNH